MRRERLKEMRRKERRRKRLDHLYEKLIFTVVHYAFTIGWRSLDS